MLRKHFSDPLLKIHATYFIVYAFKNILIYLESYWNIKHDFLVYYLLLFFGFPTQRKLKSVLQGAELNLDLIGVAMYWYWKMIVISL